MKTFIKPLLSLPGLYLGIPINLLSYYYTTHLFHTNIITPEIVLLNCAIGCYTYGTDKIKDIIIYNQSLSFNNTALSIYETKKYESNSEIINYINWYKKIYDKLYFTIIFLFLFNINKETDFTYSIIESSIVSTYIYSFHKYFTTNSIITTNTDVNIYNKSNKDQLVKYYYISLFLILTITKQVVLFPFIFLFDTTDNYIELKEKYGEFKAIYVSFMWSMVTIIMPSVLYENNYNILNYPTEYMVPFFTIFSLTNLVDSVDLEEDRRKGINTIPVKYGVSFTRNICFILLTIIFYKTIYND